MVPVGDSELSPASGARAPSSGRWRAPAAVATRPERPERSRASPTLGCAQPELSGQGPSKPSHSSVAVTGRGSLLDMGVRVFYLGTGQGILVHESLDKLLRPDGTQPFLRGEGEGRRCGEREKILELPLRIALCPPFPLALPTVLY